MVLSGSPLAMVGTATGSMASEPPEGKFGGRGDRTVGRGVELPAGSLRTPRVHLGLADRHGQEVPGPRQRQHIIEAGGARDERREGRELVEEGPDLGEGPVGNLEVDAEARRDDLAGLGRLLIDRARDGHPHPEGCRAGR